ncbi:MAG: 1-acyl-sn-glycerol-3-phosphate acyltransferase, partial [Acidobacteriota bacterium]
PAPDPGPGHDPFGMDRDYVASLGRTLFRFLHDHYWRIEWRGIEHVPATGRAVLAGVHRGHQPWDGVMVLHRLAQSLGRHPRFLIHPTLVKHPFVAPYMTRCGGLHACRENGDWVLENEGLLAIFPEGIKGAFATYRDAYRLRRFGRHDFVKFALRQQCPIVPFVIVGSAEIFPILGEIHWSWWKRFSEWPFLPITPTMSLVPLPSKWHAVFLEPLPVDREYGPEAADDQRIVRAISDDVKARMAAAIESILDRRRHIFFGSVFDRADWPADRLPEAPRATSPSAPKPSVGPGEVVSEPVRRATI